MPNPTERVDAVKRAWQPFPARQLTGTPKVYHAYIGRKRPEITCCQIDHRSVGTAEKCAQRAARKANRRE